MCLTAQERLALAVASAQDRRRRAASGGADLPLTIREMRLRLSDLGLTVTGTRVELEARLAEYARATAEMALDAERQAQEEREGSIKVLDPRAQLLLGYEPSASVAGAWGRVIFLGWSVWLEMCGWCVYVLGIDNGVWMKRVLKLFSTQMD